jgi:hypothetical protein
MGDGAPNPVNQPPGQRLAVFAIPEQPRSRTSDVIHSLLERAQHERLTLGSITERFGDRTFGFLLVLFAVFNVIPFVSIVFGLLIVILGAQMAIGMTQARLPGFVLRRELPSQPLRSALLAFEPRVRAIERFVRPRWQFSEAPVIDRINGLLIMLLGLVVAIPLPFTNLGPSLVLALMGVGLIERDGLVQMLAFLSGLIGFILAWLMLS